MGVGGVQGRARVGVGRRPGEERSARSGGWRLGFHEEEKETGGALPIGGDERDEGLGEAATGVDWAGFARGASKSFTVRHPSVSRFGKKIERLKIAELCESSMGGTIYRVR